MSDHSYPTLLVVEDSDEDFEALSRIMNKSCDIDIPITRCYDGDDALDFLYREGDYAGRKPAVPPGAVLLDLNLPGTDGREILAQIKQDEKLKTIPVVVMTTSSNPKDIDECYRAGANSYILKPTNIEQLKVSIQLFVKYWFTVSVPPKSL
ncbi:MAG: response regulator [Cyanobacteria bacterium P01_A01_bin.137]